MKAERKRGILGGAPIWMLVLTSACIVLTAALNAVMFIVQPTAVIAVPVTLIAPAAAILVALWADAYSRSRAIVYVWAFAWGAAVATALASIANTSTALLAGDNMSAVASAPVFEECLKVCAVLIVAKWLGGLDSPLKGAVIGAIAGAGFTLIEDVNYLFVDNSSLTTALGRALIKPVFHMATTALAGACVAWALTRARSTASAWAVSLLGLAVAMGWHSLWNSISTLGSAAEVNGSEGLQTATGLAVVILGFGTTFAFFGCFVTGRWVHARTVRKGALCLARAGRLSEEEAEAAGNLRARRELDRGDISVSVHAARCAWQQESNGNVETGTRKALEQARAKHAAQARPGIGESAGQPYSSWPYPGTGTSHALASAWQHGANAEWEKYRMDLLRWHAANQAWQEWRQQAAVVAGTEPRSRTGELA